MASPVDHDMAEDLTSALVAAQVYVISQNYVANGLGEQSLAHLKAQFLPPREGPLIRQRPYRHYRHCLRWCSG